MKKSFVRCLLVSFIMLGTGCTGWVGAVDHLSPSASISPKKPEIASASEDMAELPWTFAELEAKMKKYLDMTVAEIIDLTNSEMPEPYDGSLVIFSPHFSFPCIFPGDIEGFPFYVVCSNYDTSLKPFYLGFYDEHLILSGLGLNKEMNFAEIMEVMGPAEIDKSTPLDEEKDEATSRYKIEYKRNGLVYVFCSWMGEKEGEYYELFVDSTSSD